MKEFNKINCYDFASLTDWSASAQDMAKKLFGWTLRGRQVKIINYMIDQFLNGSSNLSLTSCETADGKTSILLILAALLNARNTGIKILIAVPDIMHAAICSKQLTN